jgi:heme-degrading monooxygenase HmoA
MNHRLVTFLIAAVKVSEGAAMVARTWRGWTKVEDAERYADYMSETGVAGLAATSGNRGVYIFRRIDGDRAEFVVTSLWESREAIHGFAGDDIDKAVFYPEDDAFLVEREWTCTHYDVPVAHAVR